MTAAPGSGGDGSAKAGSPGSSEHPRRAAGEPGRPSRSVQWLAVKVLLVQGLTLAALWLLQSVYGTG